MHQPPPTSYLGAGSIYRFTTGVLRKFFNKKVGEAIQVDKAFTKHLKKNNGEGGIRTRGRGVYPYDGLANRCLQPLGHLSE